MLEKTCIFLTDKWAFKVCAVSVQLIKNLNPLNNIESY